MDIVNTFLTDLKAALPADELAALKNAHGATKEDLEKLKASYPQCPSSLIRLLEQIDGTYWRQYGEEEVSVCILGSDIEGYPYYLLSTQQMLESSQEGEDVSYLTEDGYEEDVDPRINQDELFPGTYIHFSDCMNNGGTSRLYIDFNPSKEGACGQIIRYVHDPDEFKVIANSFDEYLQQLIDCEFYYLLEDEED